MRQLIRARLFSVPVVAGLALAIGATTSVFSVFHAMLIRPMGFGQVENLAAICRTDEAHGQENVEVSYGDLLGGCALLLAAIGVYGVLAYAVTRRRREIGVRVVVGATPMQVARLVAGDAMRLLTAGLAVGLAGAVLWRDWLSALLFGVGEFDLMAYGGAVLALVIAALTASVAPAIRAASTDPARALQSE